MRSSRQKNQERGRNSAGVCSPVVAAHAQQAPSRRRVALDCSERRQPRPVEVDEDLLDGSPEVGQPGGVGSGHLLDVEAGAEDLLVGGLEDEALDGPIGFDLADRRCQSRGHLQREDVGGTLVEGQDGDGGRSAGDGDEGPERERGEEGGETGGELGKERTEES